MIKKECDECKGCGELPDEHSGDPNESQICWVCGGTGEIDYPENEEEMMQNLKSMPKEIAEGGVIERAYWQSVRKCTPLNFVCETLKKSINGEIKWIFQEEK